MSYYLDVIYNRKTNDYDASEKKIKKETNDYISKIRNKKNKLKIIGDIEPLAPSNNQQPITLPNDIKLNISSLIKNEEALKLVDNNQISQALSNQYNKIYSENNIKFNEKDDNIKTLKEEIMKIQAEILREKFRFCFVSINEKGSSFAFLTLDELEERIKNRRIQFQINL